MLNKIQQELKAPKNQYNSFGKYKYRSCEDIIEAAKPVLAKFKAYLLLTDDIVQLGSRFYVKATATVKGEGWSESATAFAREAESRKGMDESQITGSASSYARKYALSGLFGLDDTKDADTMDNREQEKSKKVSLDENSMLSDKKFIRMAQTMEELDDAIAAIKAKRGEDTFKSMRSQYVVAYNQRKAEIMGSAK